MGGADISRVYGIHVFSFLCTIYFAIFDLAVQFVPDGTFKRRLIKGHFEGRMTPEKLARDYASSGYIIALLPIIVPAVVICIGIILLLVIGGYELISNSFQESFSG